MNILITGGRGYLGGHLCQHLGSAKGYQVFSGSRRPISGVQHIAEERVMNWSSRDSLLESCTDIDTIVHLAAMNANDCGDDSIAALTINGVGTARLLEAAKIAGVRRFLYISTAHVYGNPLVGNITEETLPFPVHPYATSHRAAEDLVLAAQRAGQIEGVVIRLSNAFGSPMRADANCWDLLFNDLCRQAVTKKTIMLRSTGMQKRDFVPIKDVCRAIKHLLILPLESFDKPLFNVGGNWSPTVFDVALLVAGRFEERKGYRPQINRLIPKSEERATNLSYCIDRLRGTGFILEADKFTELDGLIDFCTDIFG